MGKLQGQHVCWVVPEDLFPEVTSFGEVPASQEHTEHEVHIHRGGKPSYVSLCLSCFGPLGLGLEKWHSG